MAIPLTINGAVFEYPQNFDEDWGVDATGWAQAVTAGALYLSGGNFPLTAQVDFGTSFGIKVKSILTETANPSTAGYLALARTDTIGWRNNANSGNLLLAVNGTDMLTFNGSALGLTSLTNNHIYVGNGSNVPTDVAMSGDATIVASGALTIANGAITNAKVNASAAIALTKLAATTASRALVSDASGFISPATTTSTQIGYLSTTTSDVQVQLDARLPLAGGTMSGAINMASNKITSLQFGTATGDAAAYGQLKILQYKSATTTATTSTTSTTFVSATGMTLDITPSSVSSKILIVAQGMGSVSSTTAGDFGFYTLTRNLVTNLGSASGIAYITNFVTSISDDSPVFMMYLDSPATTSSTTYDVQLRSPAGTVTTQWQRAGTPATLMAFELAG